LMRIYLIE